MNKTEAAEILGVTTRTLMAMLSRGEIASRKIRGKTGEEHSFDEQEVLRVKWEREQGIHVGRLEPEQPANGSTALAVREPGALEALTSPESHEAVKILGSYLFTLSTKEKLTLTLDEAAAYSGLGVGYLRKAIEEKKLKALSGAGKRGSTVVKKSELERFIAKL